MKGQTVLQEQGFPILLDALSADSSHRRQSFTKGRTSRSCCDDDHGQFQVDAHRLKPSPLGAPPPHQRSRIAKETMSQPLTRILLFRPSFASLLVRGLGLPRSGRRSKEQSNTGSKRRSSPLAPHAFRCRPPGLLRGVMKSRPYWQCTLRRTSSPTLLRPTSLPRTTYCVYDGILMAGSSLFIGEANACERRLNSVPISAWGAFFRPHFAPESCQYAQSTPPCTARGPCSPCA